MNTPLVIPSHTDLIFFIARNAINPQTGRPYGGSFPWITLADIVDSQVQLLNHLDIKRLHAVIGGSLGGMLAINFDISLVFVDAFMKLVNCTDPKLLEPLFNQMESLSRDHNVNFVLGVSGDPELLPEFITRYAV